MRNKLLIVIAALALGMLTRDIILIAGFPPEANQGAIFKIIFFHVPMAITALMCAAVALIASIGFLITRNFKYDAVAVAVTETGLAFSPAISLPDPSGAASRGASTGPGTRA